MGVELRPEFGKDSVLWPWVAICDVPECCFSLAAKTQQSAEAQLHWHVCPRPTVTKMGLMMSKTLLQEGWAKLDDVVEALYISTDQVDKDYLKAQAKGMAEILALFMVPHFTDAKGISAEAARRYKARQAGDETYETPGLGSRATEQPQSSKYMPSEPAQPKPVIISLTEGEQDMVRQMVGSGLFTVQALAKQLGKAESEIQAVLNTEKENA